jgi:hypothetical protein
VVAFVRVFGVDELSHSRLLTEMESSTVALVDRDIVGTVTPVLRLNVDLFANGVLNAHPISESVLDIHPLSKRVIPPHSNKVQLERTI